MTEDVFSRARGNESLFRAWNVAKLSLRKICSVESDSVLSKDVCLFLKEFIVEWKHGTKKA